MIPTFEKIKHFGEVFTPNEVARALVGWSVRQPTDHLLDPSCGDGRFLAYHSPSTGIELDVENAALARKNAIGSKIHSAEFFKWASVTPARFDAVVGNPPFIRYQNFSGECRQLALDLTRKLGVHLNGLASSWAAFLVVAAGLLKPGGRMAFVVPAEIGHAPYSIPVLRFLSAHFKQVRVVAIREKLFPTLSEAAWLLFADGYGGSTDHIELCWIDSFAGFQGTNVPGKKILVTSWEDSGCRLRKFFLSEIALSTYKSIASRAGVTRLGAVAQTSIGYVSGANEFFHLRPSEASHYGIPNRLFRIAIRRARQLPNESVTVNDVKRWLLQDEQVMLLNLAGVETKDIPPAVIAYLETERGYEVRKAYKCRNREPWYAVPDVQTPDGFLSYMSGVKPVIVQNAARCVCANSVHAVFEKNGVSVRDIQKVWSHPLVDLSCELEGHPLGGGMLKLEPREASNVLLPIDCPNFTETEIRTLKEATTEMRQWRNYAHPKPS